MHTKVHLLFLEGRIEHWVRFGRIVDEEIIDRRHRLVAFEAGEVFAFVRWQGGEHGTEISRIDVIRAARPGEPYTTVPFVTPGGQVLLHVEGWRKVQTVLAAIDSVEAAGISARNAAPDYWRHVGNRLAAGLRPRGYSVRRHHAWLMRRSVRW